MSKLELLKDPRVKKEIERYKWVESEKFGFDIGREWASHEWLLLYSSAWQEAHPPRKRFKT